MIQWSLQKLLENTSSFRYNVTDPLSMMALSMKYFRSKTPVKYILSQLQ